MHEHLDGPDFLEAYADVELNNGNEINAAEFRKRAQQWRRDLNTAHQYRNGNGPTVSPAPQPDRAATVRDPRTLPMPGDRMYLPVQVSDVGYGRGGFDLELFAVVDGQPAFDITVLYENTAAGDQGAARWLRGGIAVVPAPAPELVTPAQAAA